MASPTEASECETGRKMPNKMTTIKVGMSQESCTQKEGRTWRGRGKTEAGGEASTHKAEMSKEDSFMVTLSEALTP